jgi:4-hydroxybenzoate polyprenyltransferase
LPDFLKLLKKIGHYIIYSNIFIAVAALCLVLETQVLLGAPMKLNSAASLAFFGTLFVYNISRIQLVNFYYHRTTILAFTGCVISLYFVPPAVVYISIPLGMLSLSYSIRLRKIPLLKIFLIAIVWGFTTVLIPALDSGILIITWPVLLALLRRMLFVFAITIPFDIRDQAADAEDRLQTLPGRFGVLRSKGIAIGALFLFTALLFLDFNIKGCHLVLQPGAMGLLLSAIIAAVFVLGTSKSKHAYYYLFCLDGTLILQFLLVYFFK